MIGWKGKLPSLLSTLEWRLEGLAKHSRKRPFCSGLNAGRLRGWCSIPARWGIRYGRMCNWKLA